MEFQIIKNNPNGVISDHVPMLVVLATPPSGDSSEYRSLYLYANILDGLFQVGCG